MESHDAQTMGSSPIVSIYSRAVPLFRDKARRLKMKRSGDFDETSKSFHCVQTSKLKLGGVLTTLPPCEKTRCGTGCGSNTGTHNDMGMEPTTNGTFCSPLVLFLLHQMANPQNRCLYLSGSLNNWVAHSRNVAEPGCCLAMLISGCPCVC